MTNLTVAGVSTFGENVNIIRSSGFGGFVTIQEERVLMHLST